MLFRKAYDTIKRWYYHDINKALLVSGAPRVGKTFLIEQFLKEHSSSYVKFDLNSDKLARESFDTTKTTQDILLKISLLAKTKLVKHETVIFIDNVQLSKEIITKVKFLVEEGSYRYILSGSNLGTTLLTVNSIPVGYMNTLTIYPLDFEEFLIANGCQEETINYLENQLNSLSPVDETIHQQMMSLFNTYILVGGMPEAVSMFISENNYQRVFETHAMISKHYDQTINSYSDSLMKRVFNAIPVEVDSPNKRFFLKDIDKAGRFSKYSKALTKLSLDELGLFTYIVKEPIYPLLASKERRLFKLFLCDTGLLSHKLFGTNSISILNNNTNINYGSLYESVVAQELHSHGHQLFYYNNKKNGEVDFIIDEDFAVVPLEVKSGKDYKRHVALDNLLSNPDYNIKKAYTLCNSNVEIEGNRIYLPIYMVMFLVKEKPNDKVIFHLKIDDLKK